MTGGARRFCPDHRLHRPEEFAAVFASRQRIRGDWFELRFRRHQGPSARLGLVVPKRLARYAVLRNLLKRLAREAFRDRRAQLPVMDVVLQLTRKAASSVPLDLRATWRREIDELLNRLPQ